MRMELKCNTKAGKKWVWRMFNSSIVFGTRYADAAMGSFSPWERE